MKGRSIGIIGLALASVASLATAQGTAWRPVVMANHGMVASGHPLASMAGMRILEKGGNAVDAAVAAWTVQGLVEPGMTGLGSDAFVMIYLAKSGQVKFINATGPAPGGATPELYKAKGGIPDAGPLASDVPGALDGIGLALESYGTFSYAEAFAPAIEIAKKGFPVSYHLAGQLERRQEKLAAFPSTKAIWFRDGRPLQAGEIVVQKDYGATLETIAARGRRVFYEGEIGKALAGFIQSQGGVLSASDLAEYEAHEAEPIHINYKGYEVYEAAPNSQGHVLLQALNMLEGFDLKYIGHNKRAVSPSRDGVFEASFRRSRPLSRRSALRRYDSHRWASVQRVRGRAARPHRSQSSAERCYSGGQSVRGRDGCGRGAELRIAKRRTRHRASRRSR